MIRIGAGALTLLAVMGGSWLWSRDVAPVTSAELGRIDVGPLTVWEHIEGHIESAASADVYSTLSQRATIVYLAGEGTVAREGDELVRFDSAPTVKSLFGLERDFALTDAALRQLREADLLMEQWELEELVAKPRAEWENEKAYRDELLLLAEEDLVSPAEIRQQEAKLEHLEQQIARAQNRLELTQRHVHPAALARAEAARESALKELDFARQELASCVVRAPRAGVVIYKPIHLDGEFRTVRVGDSVYRNQTFMMVADMEDLLVRCHVPEGKLAHVAEGQTAQVTPLPYPNLQLEGRVERVGSMAHAIAGKPAWQKYVTIDIRLDESHPHIRSGMSAFVHVLSHHEDETLRIPRSAVYWRDGRAYTRVRIERAAREVALTLGPGNETHFAVRGGVREGQSVLYP